jgi:2-polyprenyl-6-methoxyphenol hydroxylase-like FAD-dependent oxidoreductase
MLMAPVEAHPHTTDQDVQNIEKTDCCIVGGGPGGAMLALLLARKGVNVTLLEMHRDFDREFRGDTIHPSVMEILDQIGLAEELHEIPHTKISGPTLQFANGTISPFNLARLKTKFGYILLVPQAKFLEFITGEAAKYANFKLVMRANVNEIVEQGGVVQAVRYSDDAGVHEVKAQVVVGADGRFSQMRRLARFDAVRTSPPMDVLWFRLPKLPGEPEISGGAFGGIGRGRILVLLERTDYWQSGLVFPKGQYQQLHAKGIAAIRQEIGEIDPRFARNAAALTDWHQVSLLSVESSRCPLWHKPGLLLIGDAAHVMSPVGGVGINYAIQDAVVAANVLTGPLKAGTVTDQHLAEVQRQREWPTKVIQAFQSFLQNRLIASVLLSQQVGNVPWQLRLLTKIPILRDFPPRMIGFGPKRVRLNEV